jgi:predicted Fe-S protein YdhL (DUF1289 family)
MRAMSIPKPPATAVRSPCINVCRMDPVTAWCEGCLRTIDEISAWSSLDDAGRLAVLRLLPARRAARARAAADAPGSGPSPEI